MADIRYGSHDYTYNGYTRMGPGGSGPGGGGSRPPSVATYNGTKKGAWGYVFIPYDMRRHLMGVAVTGG